MKLFKYLFQSSLYCAAVMFLLLPQLTYAQFSSSQAAEPSFLLAKDSSGKAYNLPLQKVRADITVTGVIAEVRLLQVYKNTTDQILDAEYMFPGSDKAAVYAMEMHIADRIIKAQIKEKEEAQKEFDEAKAAGKNASLLQQQRPNVFQMNVSNIAVGQEIEVLISYTELLVPNEGVYEFVLPTKVGDRYNEKDEESWVTTVFKQNKLALDHIHAAPLELNFKLLAPVPIADAECPTHDVNIAYPEEQIASLQLAKNEKTDKDFIFRYSLLNKQISSGLMVSESNGENYFLYMAQPPKRVVADEIPPREYIFILDVSGSMNGFPIQVSKELMAELFDHLNPNDKFNVVLFAGGSTVFNKESVPATKANLKKAIQVIENEQGSGSTQLLDALKTSFNLQQDPNYATSFVCVTDGFVTVEKEAFDLIRKNANKANFFAIGIGSSVSRYIINGMARAGNSEPLVAFDKKEAKVQAKKFRKYIQSPLLTDVQLNVKGTEVSEQIPAVLGDLFAEKPIVVFGKYQKNKNGTLQLTASGGKGKFKNKVDFSDAKVITNSRALEYLWARHKLLEISDYELVDNDEKYKADIIELGLKHNLLTNYTSFVAVDHEEKPKAENEIQNIQGNNNGDGSVPEPHEWFFIGVVLLALVLFSIKRILGK